MNIKLAFFILSYINLFSVLGSCAKFDTDKLERKIIAFMKVLKYVIARPNQMNLDAAFGVMFAEANLQASVLHRNMMFLDNYQQNLVEKALKLAKDTRQIIKQPQENHPLNAIVNHPEIWTKTIFWKKMEIGNELFPDPDITIEKVTDSIFSGHPREDESDVCLKNLIQHCDLKKQCEDFILHNENSTTGYPLTHRLLTIQVMNALSCKNDITQFFPHLRLKFCSLIMQDLINVEATGFPNVSKDLALEEVFLCGMEGYTDFVTDHYEQLVLDWQHPSGCYSGIGYNKSRSRKRDRREASFTDFGCVNHTTGLGAAVLALMIRKDIELLMMA